ncbi:glycosyltransferase family 2 protein [Roseobacter sp. YSTF-M11]|uniref:Glycosyltransferase family 2 protein n=1 Tax=Roseobacter insulae TaxID=2859783 RepID=A0A9X1K2Z4_9RHOB|nr:glycosyltransferase family 2 protein [Roseobacter insulae]MBW4710789.1 glycosyltransferase family 2 protein [Roseobacter insulae]
MPHKIAVSIINFRTAEMTLNCVQSVLDDMAGLDGHIVVVDNLSQDGSAEKIADWIAAQPDDLPVSLVVSETNSGFSGGHNQGFAAVEADFYLVLNSDAVLQPGFLRTLLEAAGQHPDKGLFAPRIDYEDGGIQDSCFRFPSPASELIRSARFSVVTRLLKHREVSLGATPAPDQIDWASFACIMLRGAMIKALGPMDEGYFMYFEDAEYCLRARRAGWGILQVPQAVVVHFRGGSGPVKSLKSARARMPRYFYSSRTRFFYQAHGWGGMVAANLMWHLGRLIKNTTRLAGRSVRPMTAAEGRDIWTNVTRPLGPRYAPGDEQ